MEWFLRPPARLLAAVSALTKRRADNFKDMNNLMIVFRFKNNNTISGILARGLTGDELPAIRRH
jgi:hypothetical protein